MATQEYSNYIPQSIEFRRQELENAIQISEQRTLPPSGVVANVSSGVVSTSATFNVSSGDETDDGYTMELTEGDPDDNGLSVWDQFPTLGGN